MSVNSFKLSEGALIASQSVVSKKHAKLLHSLITTQFCSPHDRFGPLYSLVCM